MGPNVGAQHRHLASQGVRGCRRDRRYHQRGAAGEPDAGGREPAGEAARGQVRSAVVRARPTGPSHPEWRAAPGSRTPPGPQRRGLGADDRARFQSEVRLGVPHDIVGPYMPPVLKSFDQAWPGVRVSLDCRVVQSAAGARATRSRPDLDDRARLRAMARRSCQIRSSGWARATAAPTSNPLPVSIGGEDCAFRPFAIEALNDAGRDWRPVCEISNMLASAQRLKPTSPWCRCSPRRCRIRSKFCELRMDCRRCRYSISISICRRWAPRMWRSSLRATFARSSPPATAAPPDLTWPSRSGPSVATSAVGGDAAAISARTRSTRPGSRARSSAVRGDGPRPGAVDLDVARPDPKQGRCAVERVCEVGRAFAAGLRVREVGVVDQAPAIHGWTSARKSCGSPARSPAPRAPRQ